MLREKTGDGFFDNDLCVCTHFQIDLFQLIKLKKYTKKYILNNKMNITGNTIFISGGSV